MRGEIEQLVRETRIVAIIRGYPAETCARLAGVYAESGIRLVEVTFDPRDPATWPDTAAAIRVIRARLGGVVRAGAGTVLSEEQLELCAAAGGEYAVMPHVDPALVRACAARDMASLPGAATPTEAVAAWAAGASFVKLFPAGELGPGYVKAVRAPLSHVPFLAVGGVTAENAAAFLRAGCVGVGVGGDLSRREWVEAGAWDRVAAAARALVDAVRRA